METPLISVIVPVYKVEAYLDRCVQSIVDQTYQNLEIILVNDGSPDNCPAMCDAWAGKDSRIKVIHQENGGLSDARNAGMAIASGEYIGFVDSDDYIAPDMYRLLLERIMIDGSDIAACGVDMVFENESPARPLTQTGCCILNRKEAMEAVIRESWLKQPVWYKLYKAALIRDILFPTGKYHEDIFWTWQAVAQAQRVSVFDTPCYFYVQRSGSIMSETYSLRRLDAVEARILRNDFIRMHYPKLSYISDINVAFTILYHGQLVLKYVDRPERRNAFEKLRKLYPSSKTLCQTGMKSTHRFWLKLAEYNLSLCCRLRNILRIGL